jgi:hypothetical protein
VVRNFSREEKSRVYTLVLAWLYIVGIVLLLQGRSSISDVVLDWIYNIKKLCWVFFPVRVSQDNTIVSFLCLVYLSVDLFNVKMQMNINL